MRVDLKNAGDRPASPLTVEAELFGAPREARLDPGVAPGETRAVTLSFPLEVPRPGLHALTLLLAFPEVGAGAAGSEPLTTQRAYLLLAFGENPGPAVTVEVALTHLDTTARLPVALESADGVAHRVRLRVLTPRGLRADDPEAEIAVPAQVRVSVAVPVLRAGAPRPSQQGLLVVATEAGGPVERTAVAAGVVEVAPDSAWLPRHRALLLLAAGLLLAAAVLAERRGRPGGTEA